MKAEGLRQALEEVAEIPGLQGCALVEVDAGMVWHAAGQVADMPKIAEVCSDYWRLYQRHKVYFEQLGELRAQVMMHRKVRITLQPCGQGMLLIALSREQDAVDWARLQAQTRELKSLVLTL
jgi:predicted regulator of Ras-like GTPase activity (Roadblock/LC7/MglB family)